MIYQVSGKSVPLQEKLGFPFLQGQEPSLRAMNALWFFAERHGRAPAAPPSPPPSDLTPDTLETTLASYGISLPRSRVAVDVYEAAAAADEIGYPVALKIRSPDILHKTEAGGVILHLRSRREVRDAAERLLAAAQRRSRTRASRACWCRKWSRASRRSSALAPIRCTARCC